MVDFRTIHRSTLGNETSAPSAVTPTPAIPADLAQTSPTTAARVRFVAGVHGPDTALVGDQEVRAYVPGSLQRYLTLLGVMDDSPAPARGAIAHVKIRDEAGAWRRGRAPEIAPSVKEFLKDARALGFRTVVAWIPHGAWTPAAIGPALPAERDRLRDAARAVARALGDLADGLLFGNEPEALLGPAPTTRDWAAYWAAEAIAGAAWRAEGKAWIAGADMSASHLVDTLPSRVAAWEAVLGKGALPDALAAHLYGEGGDQPEHLEVLLRAILTKLGGRVLQLIVTEWALGFESAKVERGSKEYLRDARARDYTAAMAARMAELEILGCFFTLREIMEYIEQVPESYATSPAVLVGLQLALLADPSLAPAPILNPQKAMAKGMRLEREAREVA